MTGDEFAIWDRALSRTEVMALHAAQRSGRQLTLSLTSSPSNPSTPSGVSAPGIGGFMRSGPSTMRPPVRRRAASSPAPR